MTTLQQRYELHSPQPHKRKLETDLLPEQYEVDNDKIAESALREGIDIPEAKRRAQNRAAQRAFRERKEKHLKDLEARLEELESESRSWKSTNMALRNKLSLLESELQQYRWNEPGTPGIQQNQSRLPQQTPQMGSMMPSQMTPQMGPTHMSPSNSHTGSNAGSNAGSILSPPGLTDSSGSTPNRSEDFCAKLSTACVVDQKKIAKDAPYISADVPGWQQDEIFGRNIDQWLRPGEPKDPLSFVFNEDQNDPLNLDFGALGTQFDEKDDLMGLLNNDINVFDPLDGLLEWNPPIKEEETNNEIPTQQQQQQQQLPPPQQQQQQINTQSQQQFSSPLFSPAPNENLIKSPLLGAYEMSRQDDQVPSASQKFIQCADVWDRICSHPKFGEIDINSMCQELRNKARCSKTGVVLDEQDVNAVLKSMR